jgi:chromosome segregation ATPase
MVEDAPGDEPVQNGVVKSNLLTVEANGNGLMSPALKSPGDAEAQALVIDSLRSQVQELYSQVTQLNGKLVKSYDRVSDLEDELHMSTSNLRNTTLKVSQLEVERTQHLSALNTGLLVEKSNVTAELNRLMEKATEEAAQRGQAESARHAIEKDLDDLSASLFDQANTMVAEARYAQFQSEQKIGETEALLKKAEDDVKEMQVQMQIMQTEKENADRRAHGLRLTMSKGKWVERDGGIGPPSIKLLSSHLPYQDFLLFVAHLRSIHPSSPQAPTMATLLPLPFLARLLSEDSYVN